jgi:hypothetical protein
MLARFGVRHSSPQRIEGLVYLVVCLPACGMSLHRDENAVRNTPVDAFPDG